MPAPRLNYYDHLLPFTFTWFHSFNRSKIEIWSSTSFLRSLNFILLPIPRLNFDHLFLVNLHLISFFHPLPVWIWLLSSFFRSLDFVLSTAPSLNFDNLILFYIHLISFFQPIKIQFLSSDSFLHSIDFIFSLTFRIELRSSAPFLRSLDFIYSIAPILNFVHLIIFYVQLMSLFKMFQDWILIIYFLFTYTWFHCCNCSHIELWSSASFLRSLNFILLPTFRLIYDQFLRFTFTWYHLWNCSKIKFYHLIPFYF